MEINKKWIFAYALTLVQSAKLSLFACAILSLLYAYALYTIAGKVQFNEFGEITAISLGAGGVILLKFLTQLFSDFISIKLSALAQRDVIRGFESRLLHLKNNLSESQILHRLTVDFTQFSESLVQGVIQMVTQGIVTIFIGGYLVVQYQRELPRIILFLAIGLFLALSLHLVLKFLTRTKAQIDSDVFRYQKNIIAGSDYLIASGRFSSWAEKFYARLAHQVSQDKKISVLQHCSSAFNWGARYVFILMIITPLVIKNDLSSVSIYWLYIMLGLFTQLFWTLFHFGQVRIYAKRAHEIMKKHIVKRPIQHQGRLRVDAKNLTVFFGPQQKTRGVKDLNFCWESNDKVWLEGPSGAGKTTILKAILGLHNNFEGSLIVPDKNFRVAYLSQEPFFFDGESLGDNLDIHTVTDNFREIADRLNLTSFFGNIDWNLQLRIGSEGILPSQGQRLRLALLRELLQKPDLLLLDEPSANVDLETAKQIILYLGAASSQKITVICEHKKELEIMFNPTHTISI